MKRLIQKWLGIVPPENMMESIQLLHQKIDTILEVVAEPRQVPYDTADIKYIHDVLVDIMHILTDRKEEPKKKGRKKKA